ncbi:sulfotransferase 1A1-like isoform X2 [Homarus americanus]|nr:sulfotransferase 1A1-like isoform X2 [Homarus americanus]
MSLASGHNLVSLEGEELARQERDWQGYSEGIVRLHPGRWLFPSTFKRFADEYYNFKLKPDDVVLLTWPKCGTTWLQEIMWTMRYNPDLNNPMAAAPVNARVPFLEMDTLLKTKNIDPIGPDHPLMQGFKKMCPGREPENGVFLQMCELAPEPRTFKSHLALPLLPTDLLKTSKAVYMARNPKDAVVSFFHHSRIFKNHDFKGTFEEFVQYFLDDDCVYGPYWLHLKEAWKQRKNPNLHFMFFEDLKNNNMEELKKLDKFLGTNLSQEQLDNVAHYTSFAEMKARDAVLGAGSEIFFNVDIVQKDGGFFRQGKVGDWKGKYTPELEAKMDKWIKKNLGDFGIEFKYGV